MSNNWQKSAWPVSQTVLSWIVVILFIALAGDWGFIEKGVARYREHAKQAIVRSITS